MVINLIKNLFHLMKFIIIIVKEKIVIEKILIIKKN